MTDRVHCSFKYLKFENAAALTLRDGVIIRHFGFSRIT